MTKLVLDATGKCLSLTVNGTLHSGDYHQFIPTFEEAIKQHGKVRALFVIEKLEGITAGALWEEFKFDARHIFDFERVAVAGEASWEAWLAKVCNAIPGVTSRYFKLEDRDAAWEWLQA